VKNEKDRLVELSPFAMPSISPQGANEAEAAGGTALCHPSPMCYGLFKAKKESDLAFEMPIY